MPDRVLMKGNEAVGEAAIRAGCRFYFGYPITPQTELLEYMCRRLPDVGGTFLQTESELAAICTAYGVAATGRRVMTSSSGPGISLMSEGISYAVAAQLPIVLVNVTRAGPGLGRIPPAQSDYYQATRGAGHGDCHLIVLAPASVQEMADLTTLAFALADKYRSPALVLADAMLGQMMESLEWGTETPPSPPEDWALSGATGRPRNLVLAAPLTDDLMIELNRQLVAKYAQVAAAEQRWEEIETADAELVVVAFGSSARLAMEAMDQARAEGRRVGMIRPITLWPFPVQAFARLASRPKAFLVVEMNAGQMVDDVRLAVNGSAPVHFFGLGGGWIPFPHLIKQEIDRLLEAPK